jgi:hypothetical protein
MARIQWKVKDIHTVSRTSTPTKIAFAGGNGTCERKRKIITRKDGLIRGAHDNNGLAKGTRNYVEELDYRVKAVDQFAMLVPISSELVCFILKQLKDSICRVTILNLVDKRMFGKVNSSLLCVVGQGIDNELKIGRGGC